MLVAQIAAIVFYALAWSERVAAQEMRPVEHAIVEAFNARKLNGLHSVLAIFKGEMLAEVHFDGIDERWGQGLGVVPHGSDTLHDVRSITKSVTSLLYGIAMSEGKVPGTDAKLLAQFPEYTDLAGDPMRDRITVADTLSMRMGIEDALGLAIEHAADRYRYVLEQPMIAAPGEHWSYNDGAPTVIGKLIEDGTGMALEDYARDKLFQPLGITQWEWNRASDGTVSTTAGLRLSARDLGKIGRLVLDGGKFDGRQVVPRKWLEESFTPRGSQQVTPYGYFWWLANPGQLKARIPGLGSRNAEEGKPSTFIAARGKGGQRLSVQTDIGLIVVVLAGNYYDSRDWELPLRIVEEYIAPQIRNR